MASFKIFKHQTVFLTRKPGKLISVCIEIKRHTGVVHTYGLTIPSEGRSVISDKHNLYWQVREALELKGFDFSEVYY